MSQSGDTVVIDRDLVANAIGGMIYSFALGIATVALPLLALDSGYGKAAVGYLTASSAITQMGARLVLGAVMRRYADWLIIFAAGGLLAVSSTVVAVSAAPVPFVVAELLQGAARGCFGTGNQTHVVRGEGPSIRRLAGVNFVSSIGLLSGPIAAGFIANHSLPMTMYTAAAAAVLGMIPPVLLDRLPPFVSVPGRGRNAVWRRRGVDVGCLAGVTAGTWRGMLSSYLPVALQRAGESTPAIGGLISVANGAMLAGGVLAGRANARRVTRMLVMATVAAGAGTALLGALATVTPLEVGVLVLSGLGAGALQTLGPAVATEAVGREERGDAIAVAGAYRAGALFAAPVGVGASLSFMPLNGAIAVAGGLISLPSLISGHARRAPATDHPDQDPTSAPLRKGTP